MFHKHTKAESFMEAKYMKAVRGNTIIENM